MKKVPAPNWKWIREQLWERCGGFCEVSGVPLDPETFDVHHRRNGGMGGTRRADKHSLPNLLAVTPAVHNAAPHGEVSIHGNPEWSMPLGYLLYQNQDPAVERVVIYGLREVILLPELVNGSGYKDVMVA